jgi:hypothetical protein
MTQLKTVRLLAVTLILLAAAAAVSGPQSPDQFKVPNCQNEIKAPKQKPSSDCCKPMQAADAHASCI